ncbi:hypothetical protein [Deinococcus apachensis]|uniref:hypothetical protein n=1 Tax=Deinococcus apachensis TaxID=309886 RepID=UPI0003A528E2|nr:hypothetical protein [Deinococcus apachensis]
MDPRHPPEPVRESPWDWTGKLKRRYRDINALVTPLWDPPPLPQRHVLHPEARTVSELSAMLDAIWG